MNGSPTSLVLAPLVSRCNARCASVSSAMPGRSGLKNTWRSEAVTTSTPGAWTRTADLRGRIQVGAGYSPGAAAAFWMIQRVAAVL
jgi:hypothetical protein